MTPGQHLPAEETAAFPLHQFGTLHGGGVRSKDRGALIFLSRSMWVDWEVGHKPKAFETGVSPSWPPSCWHTAAAVSCLPALLHLSSSDLFPTCFPKLQKDKKFCNCFMESMAAQFLFLGIFSKSKVAFCEASPSFKLGI